MKRIFSLLCIISIIAISNCSRIPENNDPILGVWARTATDNAEGKQTSHREEWIFNDAFLGRYHSFNDKQLEFYTDFSWTIEDGVYTIEYRGTDIPNAHVKLMETGEPETLQYEGGGLFATRNDVPCTLYENESPFPIRIGAFQLIGSLAVLSESEIKT